MSKILNFIKRLVFIDFAYVSNNGTQFIRFYRFDKMKLGKFEPHTELRGRTFDYVVLDEVFREGEKLDE